MSPPLPPPAPFLLLSSFLVSYSDWDSLIEQLLRLRSEAADPESAQRLSHLLSSHSAPWPAGPLILAFQDIYKSLLLFWKKKAVLDCGRVKQQRTKLVYAMKK